jgi:hypothetical protein
MKIPLTFSMLLFSILVEAPNERKCISWKKIVDEMKELVELGKERGKVLPVSEAFVLHPVEDEVHEGKLEYWSKEVT